jgi:hypothetical protein
LNDLIARNFLAFFPVYFIALWLGLSTVVGWLSGWFKLMSQYPDQNEPALFRIVGQSGTLSSWVGMHGVLRFSVCPSGLRVGMLRLFGPFCRDFLVPWQDITVSRRTRLFWSFADLQFGNPIVGRLTISGQLADRLAREADGRWPEAGSSPPPAHSSLVTRLFVQWALLTCGAALFFTIVPRLAVPTGQHPPILVAVLFPALAFGLIHLLRYFFESR